MRVLFASSEVFPLVKTGGLADVSGALPAALAQAGIDVRILLPGYPAALKGLSNHRKVGSLGDPFGLGQEAKLISGKLPGSGVSVWVIDCPLLYDRAGGPYQDEKGADYPDNWLRFAMLSWTAAHLCTDGSPVKWRPHLLHCHDWQTGLAPAYLEAWKVGLRPATLFTIHNIAYQGQFPPGLLADMGLPERLYHMDGLEYWNSICFLKAGLYYADGLSTVSPRYAREIQSPPHGCGMEGLLAHRAQNLTGILNGADYAIWDPARDSHLTTQFTAKTVTAGKSAGKAALQAELGLEQKADAPLFVIVSRLNEIKGMDLVLAELPTLIRLGGQLAVLGTGDKWLEDGFAAAAANHPGQVAVRIGYSEPLAHRMLAGADMLLMPSRSEPCGLTQIYAQRYGTVPVVHATGGLADTVADATFDGMLTGTATGFTFEYANAGALAWSLERAIGLYGQGKEWKKIQKTGLAQDFNWTVSARQYIALYQTLVAQRTAMGKDQ